MIGEAVRDARQLFGFNGDQLAEMVGWSASKVSRLEAGVRGCTTEDLSHYLGMSGASPAVFRRVMDVHRQVGSDLLVHRHAPAAPDQVWTLVRCEAAASLVVAYEPTLLPALVQNENYAHFVLASSGVEDAGEVRALVDGRIKRQRVLYGPGAPMFEFLVPDAVLRTMVGDHGTMEDQFMHLVLLSQRDNVSIRVIPAGVRGAAWLRGQFTLMEHEAYPAVVHLELDTTSALVDTPDAVKVYRDRLRRLRAAALDVQGSRELLLGLAHEYGAYGTDSGGDSGSV
ncbi:helix-turn-helix transcriptional regulator [Actinosynnema sp. NPDC020468]|uniref:helix-turn-helix domain-containing protein n=1 Tax=Actinosynnema sp. NPDC020468 TaxID=3154488 RepID=UPI0034027779